MSNLNMPNTTHAALSARFRRGGKSVQPLCYATTVERSQSGDFRIRQHGNIIAEVGPLDLYVSNAGWGSSTTRTRLNAILSSHGLPFYVAQRQGDQVLYQRVNGEHVELTRSFMSITFDTAARAYSLNGSAAVGF